MIHVDGDFQESLDTVTMANVLVICDKVIKRVDTRDMSQEVSANHLARANGF